MKLEPIRWAFFVAALGAAGFAVDTLVLQSLMCDLGIREGDPMPIWLGLLLFSVFCMGWAAVWVPMALAVMLLDPRSDLGRVLLALAIILGAMVSLHRYAMLQLNLTQPVNFSASLWFGLSIVALLVLAIAGWRHFNNGRS